MNEEIVKRGYLHQQVTLRSCFRQKKTWQRVFALVRDGSLFLYDSPRDLQPLQTYPLYASCCLFPTFPKVSRSNCLQVETPSESLFLCADSPSDIKEWAIVIQKSAIIASGGAVGKLQLFGSNNNESATPRGGAGKRFSKNNIGGVDFLTPPAVNMDFPVHVPVEALASHSPEAQSLIAQASQQAAYDCALQRFRSSHLITSFTSNSLACLAPTGSYARHRVQAKMRIAAEWIAEKRRHERENRMRAEEAVVTVPMEYEVDDGKLRNITIDYGADGTKGVRLTKKSDNAQQQVYTGQLNLTNVASYAVAVRLGDATTQKWLRTNTPLFIAASVTSTVTFQIVWPVLADSSSSSASSSSSSSPTPAVLSADATHSQTFPTNVPLLVKPCDDTDSKGAPSLIFETVDDAAPTHRIGELVSITILAP